jgi:hypothetical protein
MVQGARYIIITKTNWTPKSVGSNLKAWYDFSDPTTITLNAGNVAGVRDKSGSGYDFIQPNASLQPGYDSAAATAGIYHRANFTEGLYYNIGPIYDAPTSGTMIVCGHSHNLAGPRGMPGPIRMFSVNDSPAVPWSGNNVYEGFLCSTRPMCNPLNFTANLNQDFIYTVTHTGNSLDIRWNGASLGAPTSVAIIAGTPTYQTMLIAAHTYYTATTPYRFKEGVLFNPRVDLTTIQKCEGYLAWKWNMTSRLDSSHPYKYSPPRG